MTIVYFRLLGNCRVSLASTAGASLNLAELFPRKSVIRDEFMTFKNIFFSQIGTGRGFRYTLRVVFAWRSVPSRGSCVNFSDNKNFTPSSARSSFASETKEN